MDFVWEQAAFGSSDSEQHRSPVSCASEFLGSMFERTKADCKVSPGFTVKSTLLTTPPASRTWRFEMRQKRSTFARTG